jgi:hypothetical protein
MDSTLSNDIFVNRIRPLDDILSLFRGHPFKEKQYAFCDFDDTILAIEKKDIAVSSKVINPPALATSIYGFDIDTVKEILDSSPEEYSIFQSIIYRLWHAHSAQEETQSRKWKFRLQLFIDTHIDLCIYIVKNNACLNYLLKSPIENKDRIGIAAKDYYYPHPDRFRFCGNLPDFIPLIDVGNIWYDVRPKEDSIVSALIHFFACKTQHHKCQVRNFVSIIYDYYLQYPVIIDLVRKYLLITMLGNYDSAKFRPCFQKRMEIVLSFNEVSNDSLFIWMFEHESLVYCATKEFYMYSVELNYTLDKYLSMTSDWVAVKNATRDSLDCVRGILSRYELGSTQRYELIEKELKLMHQESLVYITKLKKAPFLDIIIAEFNKYHEKKIIVKASTDTQSSESKLDDETRDTINNVCKYLKVVRPDSDKYIELRWLKIFGISEKGLSLIRDLYYGYEKLDIADNAIIKRIDEIYKSNSQDFHIIKTYFKALKEEFSYKRYKLSSDHAQRQVDALRARHIIHPWESFPEEIDIFYFCKNCKRWAHPIVDGNNTKSLTNIYAIGCEKTLCDIELDTIYCGKQTSSLAIKKLRDNGDYQKEELDDEKSARTIRKHKDTKLCTDTPLTPVSMIGWIQELDGKLYALCEVCGCLIAFDPTKFNPRGFTCNRHNEDIFTEANQISSINHPKSDDVSIARTKSGLVENSDCASCAYCGITESRCKEVQNQPLSKIRVIESNLTTSEIYLCSIDYRSCSRLFDDGNLPQKKDIMNSISQYKRKFYSKKAISMY